MDRPFPVELPTSLLRFDDLMDLLCGKPAALCFDLERCQFS